MKYSSYIAIHKWINRRFGHPLRCDLCFTPGRKEKRGWSIHWAKRKGMDHARSIDHYLGLCRKCHYLYDLTPTKLRLLRKNMLKNRVSGGWLYTQPKKKAP